MNMHCVKYINFVIILLKQLFSISFNTCKYKTHNESNIMNHIHNKFIYSIKKLSDLSAYCMKKYIDSCSIDDLDESIENNIINASHVSTAKAWKNDDDDTYYIAFGN